MKICYFFSNFHLSHLTGQPGMAYKTAKKASEKGLKVYLVSNGTKNEQIVYNNMELFLIKGDGGISGYLLNIFHIVNYVRKKRPELIHVHGHLFVIYAWVISKILRIPYVCSICETIDNKTLLPFLTGTISKYLMVFCLKRSRAIFVTSEYIKKLLTDSGVKPHNIQVVRIGIDEIFLYAIDHYRENTDVLFYGDASRHRGFDIVWELAKKLHDYQFTVLLRYVENSCKHILDEMKAMSNVKIRYYPYDEELREIILKSKLIVLPYRWMSVRPPITLLESMALGRCVVTSYLEGNEEIINEKNGVMVNLSRLDDVAEQIRVLLNNNDLRERIGKTARDSIHCAYSLKEYDKIFLSYKGVRT